MTPPAACDCEMDKERPRVEGHGDTREGDRDPERTAGAKRAAAASQAKGPDSGSCVWAFTE